LGDQSKFQDSYSLLEKEETMDSIMA